MQESILCTQKVHRYVQEMLTLEEKMDPTEFNQFTGGGYITIRHTKKFWSSV